MLIAGVATLVLAIGIRVSNTVDASDSIAHDFDA